MFLPWPALLEPDTGPNLLPPFKSWRDDVDAHASASYVPGAGEDDEDDEDRQRREDEQDAMKLLEQSTEASKREMEILDALQDIRSVLLCLLQRHLSPFLVPSPFILRLGSLVLVHARHPPLRLTLHPASFYLPVDTRCPTG